MCKRHVPTLNAANNNGHLAEVLQWVRINGCNDWDAYPCQVAADNEHLEVMQWAHQNGCPKH